MRRRLKIALLLLTGPILLLSFMALGFPVASASAASTTVACPTGWGSLPKTAGPSNSTNPITNVRSGRHDCYDRLVIDLRSAATGYDVRYVSNVMAEGSGLPIPLNGGAKLLIVVHSPTYDVNGHTTYPAVTGQTLPGINLTGYQTFRDTKFAGSFEGQTSIGLGVRARLPFRVFKLGNRIVIDVAHHW